MGFSQTFGRDNFGRVSSTTDYLGSTALRWDRDRLAARGRTSTADRWEYRYNARGEVASAWKQFGASVTTPASGEIQAATGTLYAYDDIGNRSTVQEAGRAALSTATSPTSIDTASANTTLKPTGYTVNALNQFTGVSHPVDDNGKTFFNLRGTRSAGFEVRVNGHVVDATNTALGGYQPTNNGDPQELTHPGRGGCMCRGEQPSRLSRLASCRVPEPWKFIASAPIFLHGIPAKAQAPGGTPGGTGGTPVLPSCRRTRSSASAARA